MNTEAQIKMLEGRIRLLMSRGPHNTNICNKLRRKIRQLGGEA